MLNIFTLATKPDPLSRQCRVYDIPEFETGYQVRPGQEIPILIKEGKKLAWQIARWGLLKKGQEVPQVQMQKIMTKRPYNVLIRTHRCAVPANCFFGDLGKNTRLIRVLKMRTFLMGGLYFQDPSGNYRFALLTTEPADILNGTLEHMPIVMHCQKGKEWIVTKDTKRVMQFADRSGNYWFDFFNVSSDILDPDRNDRELLKPAGLSYQQWQEREEKLRAVEFREDRINRGNTKGRH